MELRELKGVIRGQGLTYQELAGKAGMGVNTLSNKLNGKSDFDAGEIESVASVLGIGAAEVARYFFPGMLEGGGAACGSTR